MSKRTQLALSILFGFLALVIFVLPGVLAAISQSIETQLTSLPEQTGLSTPAVSMIYAFMGPMKPVGKDFESDEFGIDILFPVYLGEARDMLVLKYNQVDLVLETYGGQSARVKQSNDERWVTVRPVGDVSLKVLVNSKEWLLSSNDVMFFSLSGSNIDPSIKMEIWRNDLFDKRNMNTFFEESDYQPEQRIPNWILEILEE